MTRNAAGEWRSVEPTRIKWNAKLIGSYYRNELARRLEALGVAVAPRLHEYPREELGPGAGP